jgi:hypothetical protein
MDKIHLKAAREVNRTLQEKVRADWEYPLLAPPSGTAVSTPDIATAGTAFRERFYGTSDDSLSEDGGDSPTFREHTIEDMYAFDSPDSVGLELDRKLQERKRKKRILMEEEMATNGGLRTFLDRRNAWTGAVRQVTVNDNSDDTNSPLPAPPKITTSSGSSPADTPTSSSSKISSGVQTAAAPSTDPAMPSVDVLVPVAEPLLPPSNPVRKTLSSRSQSELYEKVVRDSRTPAIPINLAEMMQIIVQGWKDEGNFPPRGALPEPSIGSRRQRVAKKVGMRDDAGGTSGGLLANHKHLRQSVEGVKRIFRLSADHSQSPKGLKDRDRSRGDHSRPHSQEQ